MLNEEKLLNDVNVREEMLNKVEVLDKVKELFLLPELEVMTAKQVAEYYEVEQKAINKLTLRHLDELISNGAKSMTYKETKGSLMETTWFHQMSPSESENMLNKIPRRGGYFYSKRAALNIGMLLRDSVVAKEVRNALLDQQEVMTPTQKIVGLDREKELALAIMFAETEADKMIAFREYNEYKNRHIKQLEETIEHQKPKVEYADHVLNAEGSHTTSSIADDYGKSAITFNKILHDLGIQYTQSGRWYLYQQHKGKGYTETKTYVTKGKFGSKIQMKWTNKGRQFIYETLKQQSILPETEHLHKYQS